MSSLPESKHPFVEFYGPKVETEGDSLIQRLRASGLATYQTLGLPTKRWEEWKYTDLTSLSKKSFSKPVQYSGDVSQGPLFETGDALTAVFVNGFFREDLSSISDAPAGVAIDSLAGMETVPDWAEQVLASSSAPEDHSVLALNSALMRDGVVLRIGADIKVERPIHLRFITTATDDAPNPSSFLRNTVLVDQNASVTIVESYKGSDDADYFTSTASQFVVLESATVRHIKLQKEGVGSTHLATQMVSLSAKSSFGGFYLSGGSAVSRNEIHGTFGGEGAHLQLDGVFLGAGSQHCDNTTFVNHAVPSCTSSQVFKGVLDEQSRGVYQGQVTVAKDAQQTDGRQLVKTLLLSDQAEIDAKPELKIFADDVKCAHGATAGDIDDEQLFYLRSRGIDEVTARALLVEAFLTEVLERLEDQKIREFCQQQIVSWLDAHGRGARNVG